MKTALMIVFTAIIALGLSGCGSGSEAESVVESFYESFEKGDFDALEDYVVEGIGTSGDPENDEYILMLLDHSSKRIIVEDIGDAVKKGDGYEVPVVVQAPDTYEARKQAVADMLPMAGMLDYSSDDEIERSFYIGMLEKTISTKMEEVDLVRIESTLYLEDYEGGLKIEPNEGLFDTLLPNVTKDLNDDDF